MKLDCKGKCQGQCCKFILLPLIDYDEARWINYHGLKVVKESNNYYLKIDKPCKKLTEDNKCSIYEKRPGVCMLYNCKGTPEYKEVNFK